MTICFILCQRPWEEEDLDGEEDFDEEEEDSV